MRQRQLTVIFRLSSFIREIACISSPCSVLVLLSSLGMLASFSHMEQTAGESIDPILRVPTIHGL